MRRIALFVFAIGFLVSLAVAPAHAQADRTWVSGGGDDFAVCSRSAPCKTFAGAISKTNANGEINCIDSAGYGEVTITKSITISCEGVIGGILSSTTGITINAAATDFVFLKGLHIEGVTTGVNGIRILKARLVHIEDCVIRNFRNAGSGGSGILIDSTSVHFVVARTTLFNNSTGIWTRPTGGVVTGVIAKAIVDGNGSGIVLDGFNGAAAINLAVRDSTASGNTGVGALVTSSVPASMIVKSSTIADNANGLYVANAGAVLRVSDSTITGNTVAVVGSVLSYGNNEINNNAGGETVGLTALK
jgi:hypothetical protein